MRLAAFFVTMLTLTLSYSQTLIVGTPKYNPPFVMASDKQHYIGFDVDILSEICRRLKIQCRIKSLAYENIFRALDDGSIDLAIGGITITLDRNRKYDFSLPYLPSYGQYVVTYDSKFDSINDISGLKVGVLKSSAFETMLNNKSNHTANIKTYHFHSDLFAALTSGDIDVILTDRSSAEAWYNNTTHIYRLLGEPIQIGFGYGILAHKGRATLLTQINKALLAMEADNTYLKIYNTYFNPREL